MCRDLKSGAARQWWARERAWRRCSAVRQEVVRRWGGICDAMDIKVCFLAGDWDSSHLYSRRRIDNTLFVFANARPDKRERLIAHGLRGLIRERAAKGCSAARVFAEEFGIPFTSNVARNAVTAHV